MYLREISLFVIFIATNAIQRQIQTMGKLQVSFWRWSRLNLPLECRLQHALASKGWLESRLHAGLRDACPIRQSAIPLPRSFAENKIHVYDTDRVLIALFVFLFGVSYERPFVLSFFRISRDELLQPDRFLLYPAKTLSSGTN